MEGRVDRWWSILKNRIVAAAELGVNSMMRFIFATAVLLPVLLAPVWAWAQSQGAITTSVFITSITVNGIIRVAAIAAGTYIVWLGHNTLIEGVKGEFEFTGRFGRLKGSVPGILFVFLGSLVIGWALYATHHGMEKLTSDSGLENSNIKGTSVPFVPPPPPSSSP